MAILLNELFVILRLVLNRALVFWFCFFLIVLNAQGARTKDSEGKTHLGKIESHERRLGPFKINEREFTLILKLMKYQGASNGFDETVESFSIVDKEGKIHYQKSFDVEYGNGKFAESLGIWAYALDSSGRKGFLFRISPLNNYSECIVTRSQIIVQWHYSQSVQHLNGHNNLEPPCPYPQLHGIVSKKSQGIRTAPMRQFIYLTINS